MKKLFTLLSILFISSIFSQHRLIAVKGTVTDAIAYTLTEAITVAQPGDKIYLPGGFYEHLPAINKKVHIIGTGFQDGQNVMGRTTINGSLTLDNLADNSTFEGLYLTEWFTQTENCVSDNITIKRCNMKGTEHKYTSNFVNSKFINCVVRETLFLGYNDGFTSSASGENNFIKNCIITNWVYKTNSSSIENCLLVGILHCSNSFVKKNIFYRNDTSCEAINSSSGIVLEYNFFKSSCYSAYNYASTITSELSTGLYNDLSSIFLNVPNDSLYFTFNQSYNYKFNPTFIATNLSIANIIGIYNGTNPWKDGSLPIIPNIEQNNSYLDLQTTPGEFKLKVKVVPQTH